MTTTNPIEPRSLESDGKLAEPIEALDNADGPSREFDLQIGVSVDYGGHFANDNGWHWNAESELQCIGPGFLDGRLLPRFTSSIDAALTLVPDGMEFDISTTYGFASATVGTNAPQPEYARRLDCNVPIAICIAALRARTLPREPATP